MSSGPVFKNKNNLSGWATCGSWRNLGTEIVVPNVGTNAQGSQLSSGLLTSQVTLDQCGSARSLFPGHQPNQYDGRRVAAQTGHGRGQMSGIQWHESQKPFQARITTLVSCSLHMEMDMELFSILNRGRFAGGI